MARLIGRLSARQVKNAKPKKGRDWAELSDGGNLLLQVTTGKDGHIRRSWVFRYELDHKRHEMGLGPTHTISLREAREVAKHNRQLLLKRVDPLEARNQQARQQRLEAAKAMTFGGCVEAYLETHDVAWKNDKHRHQWRMTLTKYCLPIADLPIKDIDTDLVLRVLTPLWKTRTETAKRLRARIARVLSWAKGRGLRNGENPAAWSGHLSEMLAAPGKIMKVRHHPALPYKEIGAFMGELRKRHSVSARALEFLILTVARTSEVIGARWSEIDFDEKVWTISSERMKAGRTHRIPLSPRAMAILKSLPRRGDRIFDLSNMALLRLLHSMRSGLTVHGFRSTFRDWAGDHSTFPREVIEAALSHVIGDKAEQAYRRGDALMKRRKLMDSWASYCERPVRAGNVTELRKPESA
jgi:integrase